MVGDKEYYIQAGLHGCDLIHQESQDKRLTTLRSGLGAQQDSTLKPNVNEKKWVV